MSTLSRLYAKTVLNDKGCALWQGGLDEDGYGRFAKGRAHRKAYELIIGPIPDDHDLHHECDEKSCVNPWHLVPISKPDHARIDGQAAMNAKKTHCKRGHVLQGDNLYVCNRGKRTCKACLAMTSAAWQKGNR